MSNEPPISNNDWPNKKSAKRQNKDKEEFVPQNDDPMSDGHTSADPSSVNAGIPSAIDAIANGGGTKIGGKTLHGISSSLNAVFSDAKLGTTTSPLPRIGTYANQGPTRVERLAIKDGLGREKITQALSQFISERTDTSPLAIGLFGHWGSGKSSQIAFIKSRLTETSKLKIRFVEFNAWHHEKVDNIAAALSQTIVEALVQDTGLFTQFKLAFDLEKRRRSRLLKALSRDRRHLTASIYNWIITLIPFAAPAFISIIISIIILKTYPLEMGPSIGITAFFGLIGSVIGAHKFLADNLTQWFSKINVREVFSSLALPDYSAKLGSSYEMHSTLKNLCEMRISGTEENPTEGEYLLLVVDDLDRCSPQTVKQVFDAVRLVANIPRVVTFVAIDERIAFAAVEKHFDQFPTMGRELGHVARDYFAKIFQASITLPPVADNISNDFICNELFREELASSLNETTSPDSTIASAEKSNLPPSAQEKPSPISLLSVLPEEIKHFAELAKRTKIKNPRELWRMKQAWFLLKGLVLNDGAGISDMTPLLDQLFLREWMLQAPADLRAKVETWLKVEASGELHDDGWDIEGMKMDDFDLGGFSETRALIDTVLLPAVSHAARDKTNTTDTEKKSGQ